MTQDAPESYLSLIRIVGDFVKDCLKADVHIPHKKQIFSRCVFENDSWSSRNEYMPGGDRYKENTAVGDVNDAEMVIVMVSGKLGKTPPIPHMKSNNILILSFADRADSDSFESEWKNYPFATHVVRFDRSSTLVSRWDALDDFIKYAKQFIFA